LWPFTGVLSEIRREVTRKDRNFGSLAYWRK
jgi:hypothetical protein